MASQNEWLEQQIEELKKDETSFKLLSFLDGIKDINKEQQKRLQQAQDELDGRMWSPDKW
ncbi:hypothetical protein [Apilactobacillus kunkeei]|uniref:Uncharacterized protein n=1 Tax=Apilactobacillus kunkeei DSM 12361 = ATCC 700308 TaxID=1423768 RepID=A0A0R1FKX7_9LACO|nr:hypothetical protein [Apilactobacillus kunkeei]KOY68599.1 uncharacterized protein RZ73_11420 [Apilactobacillus kunkeei]KOY72767.1 uncharacterized protein RZ79_02040 [Apilactobacillus kunkeei DSM 12361 = ATCC 700308]KPN81748.1 uncharacterized protein RZ77_03320 [Apilactobacillus kunkeei]KRK22517.1 hypothetical protein FD43_GL000918 [Apilactobacillus kunkeei DSM 12361 = ATCC 700308]MCK8620031.1 hypothetical protein [Apilactobacillus kunkeei]